MTGLYVARLDLAQPHLLGVARKISDQMAALGNAGLPLELLCIRHGAISIGEKAPSPVGAIRRRLVHHLHFHKAFRDAAEHADFVYIRYQGAPPDFISSLRQLRRTRPDLPILIEFPSWPYHTERKSVRQKLAGMLQDRGTGQLAGVVDRIVTFSQQTDILNIPTLRTDNGVAVTDLPVKPVPEKDSPITLVGVANLSFWHGYDRIIAGLAEYTPGAGMPDVQFDIAGGGAELPKLRAQIERLGLQKTARLLGPVHGQDLDDLLNKAHIGISSIGMHRLDVDTSNIKSREFCARGLPFCIGYPDGDFPADFPLVHHVCANDSPVDIARLVNWYKDLRSTEPDYPQKLRAHAEAHLSWDAKMAPVVDWLATRLDLS